MENVLVRFTDNWADEMDIDEFCIIPLDMWNRYYKTLKSLSNDFEVYFGTNESNEYSSLTYLECIEVETITEHEEEIITKFFRPTLMLYIDNEIIEQNPDFINYNFWKY